MATTYNTIEDLHNAYATEPTRINKPWKHWSEQPMSDGTLQVTVTLSDGTNEVWTRAPAGTELTLN